MNISIGRAEWLKHACYNSLNMKVVYTYFEGRSSVEAFMKRPFANSVRYIRGGHSAPGGVKGGSFMW